MKQFAFILLLIGWLTNVNGQKEFKGGIIGGIVTTQMSGDGLAGWDKIGFSAGGWVSIPISEKAALTISMRYITKGSKTKLDTLTYNSFAYHLNYIDMPVRLNVPLLQRRTSLTLNIGPYADVLVKQKIVSNGYEYEVNPPFKDFDFGGSLGLTWWLGKKIFIDVSGTSSILPIRNAPEVVNKLNYYEYGNYNQTLEFTLGIRFGGPSSSISDKR